MTTWVNFLQPFTAKHGNASTPLVRETGPASSLACQTSHSSSKECFQGKQLKYFSLQECCQFLKSLGLGHLSSIFQENDVDGPLLFALAHPHFGAVMLNSMGFNLSEQRLLVTGIQNYLDNTNQ